MDRTSEYSLYSGNISAPQVGGGATKSRSPKKGKTYNPADIDGGTATAIDKFRKANRLLQKELDQVKDQLKKEQQKTNKLEKQLEISKLSLL